MTKSSSSHRSSSPLSLMINLFATAGLIIAICYTVNYFSEEAASFTFLIATTTYCILIVFYQEKENQK